MTKNDQNDPDQQLFDGYTHDMDKNRWGDCLVCLSCSYSRGLVQKLCINVLLQNGCQCNAQACLTYKPLKIFFNSFKYSYPSYFVLKFGNGLPKINQNIAQKLDFTKAKSPEIKPLSSEFWLLIECSLGDTYLKSWMTKFFEDFFSVR